MTQMVAFLRGVNLGKRTIKMDALRQSFTAAGFPQAQTLLASGNVLFDGQDTSATATAIEAQLQKDFGFTVETMLRSIEDLRAMVQSAPFKNYADDADIKRYVYFLQHPEAEKIALPKSAPGDFDVVRIDARDIFAVAFAQQGGRYGAGLDALSKPFGHRITNRNWNTVLRLIALSEKP